MELCLSLASSLLRSRVRPLAVRLRAPYAARGHDSLGAPHARRSQTRRRALRIGSAQSCAGGRVLVGEEDAATRSHSLSRSRFLARSLCLPLPLPPPLLSVLACACANTYASNLRVYPGLERSPVSMPVGMGARGRVQLGDAEQEAQALMADLTSPSQIRRRGAKSALRCLSLSLGFCLSVSLSSSV